MRESSPSQMRMRLSVSTARSACTLAASQPLEVKFSTLRSVSCSGTSLALLSTRSLNWPTAATAGPVSAPSHTNRSADSRRPISKL